jgi:single-strand DNA-binding protein
MRQTIVTGRIGQDAVIKHFDNNDRSVVNFSVADTETWKDKQGQKQEKTTWIDCSYWVKKETAEKIAQYIRKGDMIMVIGKSNPRAYADKEGKPAVIDAVNVDRIEFLGGSKKDGGNASGQGDDRKFEPPVNLNTAPDDDDMPF